jgi:signal transduction histidine kinase
MAVDSTPVGGNFERDALLRRFIHTMAFCLTLSALLHFLNPNNHYEYDLIYSVLIGGCTWVIIDLSRLFLPLDPDSGWPRGWLGIAIVPTGIVGGFLFGTFVADSALGKSTWDMPKADLRMALLATILAGLTGSLYFYFAGRSARQQIKLENAQRTAAEAHLKLLETQLEPHMLFNTLANLRVLISIDPERAQDMLDRLIAYLRATLSASRTTTHTLAAEFERLDDYLQLMEVRMGPRLAYGLDLPAELRELQVPPLLLQPLVENAIKHGLEPCVQGGRIDVSARRDGDWLDLRVADTGIGMVENAPTSGTGFGLMQVRERLATAYDGEAEIEVGTVTPRGTRIDLRLPLSDDVLDALPEPSAAPAPVTVSNVASEPAHA